MTDSTYQPRLDAEGRSFNFSLIRKFGALLREKNLRFDYIEVHPSFVNKLVESANSILSPSPNETGFDPDAFTIDGFSVYQNADLADSVMVFYRRNEWVGSIYNIGYITPELEMDRELFL
jgi:hypothetical protein